MTKRIGPRRHSFHARLAVGTVAGGGSTRAALVESLKLHVPSRTCPFKGPLASHRTPDEQIGMAKTRTKQSSPLFNQSFTGRKQ